MLPPRGIESIEEWEGDPPANDLKDGNNSKAWRCGNFRVATRILFLALFQNLIYHHKFKVASSSSRSDHRAAATASNRTTTSSFAPSWEYRPLLEPYMGNLSCMFEVTDHSLVLSSNDTAVVKDPKHPRNCGRWRYTPSEDWVPPDPAVVFDRLPHGATIYMMGDSVGRQHGVDLMCRMASAAKVVRVKVEEVPARVVPNDPREGYVGYHLGGATFQSYSDRGNNATTTKQISVVLGSGNFGIVAPNKNRAMFTSVLRGGKVGDIFVLNQGLHYKSKQHLMNDIEIIKPAFQAAMDKGARVVWRETNAGHFDTPDGYYGPAIAEAQKTKSARCVPHSNSTINASASWEHFNGGVVPLVKSLGVHVLENTWEASLLMPEWCHVGKGVDCAHLLQPGVTSFFTESLLKYIEEEM